MNQEPVFDFANTKFYPCIYRVNENGPDYWLCSNKSQSFPECKQWIKKKQEEPYGYGTGRMLTTGQAWMSWMFSSGVKFEDKN